VRNLRRVSIIFESGRATGAEPDYSAGGYRRQEWPLRLTGNTGGQRVALHQFHHEIVRTNVVNRADVRVVEVGNGPDFPLKSVAEFVIRDLDGDSAAQARVARPVYLSHTAIGKMRFDLVGSETFTLG